MHDEPARAALNLHSLEQIGGNERLQRRVARRLIIVSVGGGTKIRAHSFGVDPAIAVDGNGLRRLCRQSRKSQHHGQQQGRNS
jgi:hypothetical protein